MTAASRPHGFLGIDPDGAAAVVRTLGNPDRHLVLRGGRAGPNFDRASLASASALVQAQGIPRGVMVDCSHDNSAKDYRRQPSVCHAVLESVRSGEPTLMGLMIESNLEAGSQPWQPGAPLRRGVSITDACMSFEDTATLLGEVAGAVREGASRRAWTGDALAAAS